MPQADSPRRAEARAERSADLLTATIGDAAAMKMKMASVRRRMGELRIEQAQLEAALALDQSFFGQLNRFRLAHRVGDKPSPVQPLHRPQLETFPGHAD
jgi:hypothetical protein